jgi:flagellar biosynthetic protein FliR
MTLQYSQIFLFLLVFTRMTGALLFNPLLGRRSVPAIAKIGLALLITLVVVPTINSPSISFPTTISFMLTLIRELLLGYAMGLIVNLFLSWVLVAGEVMDMEMGLSVSKIYDPQSGVSMPVSGSVFNAMLTLIFFASSGHLTFIRIVADSVAAFPPGSAAMDFEIASHLVAMLGDVLILSLKLGMPVLAIELLSEAGLGTLMRIVPQLDVFAVGLQLKLAIGLIVVVLALPSIARLMDASLLTMFEKLQNGIATMLSAG